MTYSQTMTLTGDGSLDRPPTWNPLDCQIQCWGAGGSGGKIYNDRGTNGIIGVQGAGGSYAEITNIELPAAVNFSVGQPKEAVVSAGEPGPGGDSWVSAPNDGVFVLARGGNSPTSSSIGGLIYEAVAESDNFAEVGGGGASGPGGPGAKSTSQTGGAANGGATAGGANETNGADNANGGSGSGASAIGNPIYGGFPGGGSAASTENGGDTDISVGGAGKIVLSWNPA